MSLHIETPRRVWTPESLYKVRRILEKQTPEAILRWGIATFSPDVAMATSFGPSGIVLLHMMAEHRPGTPVFYLDTGLFFDETYRLRDRLAERFGIDFIGIKPEQTVDEQAAAHGPALWERNPDQCCALRKVQPLRDFLSDKRAWITGIRRNQAATRANTAVVDWDRANGLVKLNPLAHWTDEEIWAYIQIYELPYNELHDQGYPSIGCWPCTKPVAPGDDQRAGRWSGRAKIECGIHLQPDDLAIQRVA